MLVRLLLYIGCNKSNHKSTKHTIYRKCYVIEKKFFFCKKRLQFNQELFPYVDWMVRFCWFRKLGFLCLTFVTFFISVVFYVDFWHSFLHQGTQFNAHFQCTLYICTKISTFNSILLSSHRKCEVMWNTQCHIRWYVCATSIPNRSKIVWMYVHKLHCNVHLRFIAIWVWSFFQTKITVYVPLVSELLFYMVSFEVEYADMNSLSWISIFFRFF